MTGLMADICTECSGAKEEQLSLDLSLELSSYARRENEEKLRREQMKQCIYIEQLEKTVLWGNGRFFNMTGVLDGWKKSVENNTKEEPLKRT